MNVCFAWKEIEQNRRERYREDQARREGSFDGSAAKPTEEEKAVSNEEIKSRNVLRYVMSCFLYSFFGSFFTRTQR